MGKKKVPKYSNGWVVIFFYIFEKSHFSKGRFLPYFFQKLAMRELLICPKSSIKFLAQLYVF